MDKKTNLTPEEKLRVAHAYLINGVEQHHIASLFGVNQGRIAEAINAVRIACGFPDKPQKSYDPLSQQKSI
jgi:transposase-like protein